MDNPAVITVGDKPGVIRIYDRRINIKELNEDASLYSLLRAWVQDDPERFVEAQKYDIHKSTIYEPNKYDLVISHLQKVLNNRNCYISSSGTGKVEINSLQDISPQDILGLHIVYFKQVRKL